MDVGIPDRGVLLRIAAEARAFLEPRWEAVRVANGTRLPPGKPGSHDMCLLSTAFLKRVLEREMPGFGWTAAAGTSDRGDDVNPDYQFPGGYREGTRAWRPHFWLADGDYAYVVDLTADQFGGPSVTVAEETGKGESARYRENLFEGFVGEDLRAVAWRASGWMSEWEAAHAPGWAEAPAPPGP